MMLVQGSIVAMMPPDYTDQWGNQYQNITVQTMQGNIEGRKCSKTPYGQGDIGKQVKWECMQAENQRGPYNKFTLPPDPRYPDRGQRQPQQAQQSPQQAAQLTNRTQPAPQGHSDRDASICRQTAGKVAAEVLSKVDYSQAGLENISSEIIRVAKPIAEWFLTGKEPMAPVDEPEYRPNPNYVGDEPAATDDNIPF